MKIAVLQYFDDTFAPLIELSGPTHERYCKRHGYEYIGLKAADHGDRHPCWTKIRSLRAVLPNYDWVLYLDADALITNHDSCVTDITNFMGDRVMAICDDANGKNAGVLLVRNAPASLVLLDTVWNVPAEQIPGGHANQLGEQSTLLAGINSVLTWKRCASFAQRVFNSYLYDLYDGKYHYPQGEWCVGDFVLHLPGVDMETRKKVFTQFIHELHL